LDLFGNIFKTGANTLNLFNLLKNSSANSALLEASTEQNSNGLLGLGNTP
jgi:hypothetical protein